MAYFLKAIAQQEADRLAAALPNAENGLKGLHDEQSKTNEFSMSRLLLAAKIKNFQQIIERLKNEKNGQHDLVFLLDELIELGYGFFHSYIISKIKIEINSEAGFTVENLIWCFIKSAQCQFIDENSDLGITYDMIVDLDSEKFQNLIQEKVTEIKSTTEQRVQFYKSESFRKYQLFIKIIGELQTALSNLLNKDPNLLRKILIPDNFIRQKPAELQPVHTESEIHPQKTIETRETFHTTSLKIAFSEIIQANQLVTRIKADADGKKTLNPSASSSVIPDDQEERNTISITDSYPDTVAQILTKFEEKFTSLFPKIASVHFLRIIAELLSDKTIRGKFFFTTTGNSENIEQNPYQKEFGIFQTGNDPTNIIFLLKRLLGRKKTWNFNISAFALAILEKLANYSVASLDNQIESILHSYEAEGSNTLLALENALQIVKNPTTGEIIISQLAPDNAMYLYLFLDKVKQEMGISSPISGVFWQDYLYTALVNKKHPTLAYLILSKANTLDQLLTTLDREA